MEDKKSDSVKPAEPKRILHANGIAHKYADPSRIELEKTAWQEAGVEKYSRFKKVTSAVGHE